MSFVPKSVTRRRFVRTTTAAAGLVSASHLLAQSLNEATKTMELQIDHVMFPLYFNNSFLEIVEAEWKKQKVGHVFTEQQNPMFKGTYFQSKSFYVEYISTVKSQPYWSNTVYVVVPKKYWSFYKNPALLDEHFLLPAFGCGFALVSPEFPALNSVISKSISYDGFSLLISKMLEQALLNIAGLKWVLPSSGKIRVHDKLLHVHDIVVINESSKLVAPLLQPNPVLRDFF